MAHLGENIKQLRTERDWSQEDLAYETRRVDPTGDGVTKGTIQNIEAKGSGNANSVRLIADALDVSMDALFEREVVQVGGSPKRPSRPVVKGSGAASLPEPEPEGADDEALGREDEAVALRGRGFTRNAKPGLSAQYPEAA